MKKVTILGLATVNFPLEGEIWTVNDGYKLIDYDAVITKLFVMHKQVKRSNGEPYFNWEEMREYADKYEFEIIALHNIPIEKTKYPYQEIVDYFSTDYFTSTFCYMIAYAMFEGFTGITFTGINFFQGVSDTRDDLLERCGLEYWIGRAEQAGITVTIDGGNLLTTRTGEPYAING